MPSYRLFITAQAMLDLQKLKIQARDRILSKLNWLAENAEAIKHERLTGGFSLFCKLRMGDYRAIYSVSAEDRTIAIHAVGHRTQIYRERS
jgi:mRNA interferase RelE/StbE